MLKRLSLITLSTLAFTCLSACVVAPAGKPVGGYDKDRDGVPNQYDRDRDNDGVRNRNDDRPGNPYRR